MLRQEPIAVKKPSVGSGGDGTCITYRSLPGSPAQTGHPLVGDLQGRLALARIAIVVGEIAPVADSLPPCPLKLNAHAEKFVLSTRKRVSGPCRPTGKGHLRRSMLRLRDSACRASFHFLRLPGDSVKVVRNDLARLPLRACTASPRPRLSTSTVSGPVLAFNNGNGRRSILWPVASWESENRQAQCRRGPRRGGK
jgi:hypothetical protein